MVSMVASLGPHLEHQLSDVLSDALNATVQALADDPVAHMAAELKKKAGVFPPAVFGRLLARLHRFASAEDCWRGGAVVKDGANSAHLEVSEQQIKLVVWGAAPSARRACGAPGCHPHPPPSPASRPSTARCSTHTRTARPIPDAVYTVAVPTISPFTIISRFI